MGGRPRAAVVAIALDEHVKLAWLEGFYRGMAAVSRRYRVPIVGGDVAHHRNGLVITLTLLGEAAGKRTLSRVGAKIGDRIFVTGRLGGSLRGHHLSFTPRLDEGAWLAGRPDVRSLMDLSDGLAKDVHSLTPKGARPVLLERHIPVSAAARASTRSSGRTALAHALGDGEDYELLFTVSRNTPIAAFERAWKKRFRLSVTCIGEFRPAGEALPAGAVDLAQHHGFEHLKH
jgi:thiamine-monophosphate kinase